MANGNGNSQSYLRAAANLFKGDLSTNNEALETARNEKNGTLWKILNNLICHASINVFPAGYTRALAKRFKEDVIASFGISAKQASRWTESISAALGVRGLRKGIQPLDGLLAVGKEGPETVAEYLNVREIKTFNQFMNATRASKDHVVELAKKYQLLSPQQRDRVIKLADEIDKKEEGSEEDKD